MQILLLQDLREQQGRKVQLGLLALQVMAGIRVQQDLRVLKVLQVQQVQIAR